MASNIKNLIAGMGVLLMLIGTFGSGKAAVKGEKNVGVELGYTSRNESAVAGIQFSYAFSEHFRVAPNLQYAFRNNNRDGMLINFDFHVPLDIQSGSKFEIYPLAGLNYSCWTSYQEVWSNDKFDDVSKRKNRFGLNLGAGVGLNATESLRFTFEARYSLVKRFSTTTLALGVAYRF
ncbi:MAG: porin family protein [Muribaculaceae bacterium]|nr:porin family protein [Muribaculaceae bacterium]